MIHRPRPTWIDYMVIAVSPALIIAMLASFAFFLNEVFYGGFYTGRMNFILFMYVMGACLITRIGVEQGSTYAMLYAVPLAFVTWIATLRFVQYQGGFATVSGPLNMMILAVLWWAAYAITWDCTVIEESGDVDESGDRSDDGAGLFDAPLDDGEDQSRLPVWKRLLGIVDREHRRRAHGLSVVIFAFVALCVFAIGQMIRPTDDLVFRRYLLRLVCQVIAGALALLVTTNLLCIRRYLRQRGVSMPGNMVSVWLISGGCVIAALLLACLVLPRPSPEYSLAQIELNDQDDDLKTNSWGMGKGKEDEDSIATKTRRSDRGRESDKTGSKDGVKPSREPGGSKKRDSEQGDSEQGDSEQGDSEQGDSEQGDSEQGDSEQGDSEQGDSEQGDSEQGDSEQGDSEQGDSEQGDSEQGDSEQGDSEQGDSEQGDSEQGDSEQGDSEESSSDNSSRRSKSNLGQWLGRTFSSFMKLFVWLYYLVVICAVIYVLFRFHRQILDALRKFWRDLMGLWDSLFGRSSESAEATQAPAPPEPPYKRFGEYSSPFAGGSQFSLEQAVAYSYEALIAWGRDRGVFRSQEITPHEFAATLAASFPQIGNDARSLADLYGQLVFADGSLPSDAAGRLKKLWRNLQAE